MEEMKDTLEAWAESSIEAVSALQSFEEQTQELAEKKIIDGDVLTRVQAALEAVRPFLPDGENPITQFSEAHGEATSEADELENMLEDRDYTADEREERWGEITDHLTTLADGLDELDNLGNTKDDDED
jgi:chromosome segregation ATPase